MAGFLPALFTAGGDQFVGPKQGPLAFDVLEGRQFFPLVVEAGVVFDHGLVTIAAEALVAIGPAQLGPNLVAGALGQLGIFDGPGGIANHREAGAIHFLAGRFPWQESFQGSPQPHNRVLGNHQATAAVAMGPIEIEPLEGFKGRLDEADRTGVALGQPMVPLITPLPNAVVSDPIGPGHVIDQVLHEVPLVLGLDDHQARAGQLGQLQQKQGGGIELEMAPSVVGHHGVAAGGVELGVQGIQPIQAVFEALHLGSLAQHGVEQAPHQLHDPLLQLKSPPVVAPHPGVGHGQAPHALDRIDAVAHPGVAVVSVHRVGGACRQQTRNRVLAGEHDGFDLTVDFFEYRPGFRLSGGAPWGGRGSHVEACHPIDGWSQP